MRETGAAIRHVAAAFATLLALSSAVGAARAADFRVVPFGDQQAIVSLSGVIAVGDGSKLETVLTRVASSGRTPVAVDLDSMGGNAWAGFDVAKVMIRHHLASVVRSGRSCASSCFTAFVLGSPRFVGPNSTIGIHRSAVDGSENGASEAATVDMAILYRTIGVPASVIGEMVTTPNKSLYVLGQPEQAALGAVFTLDGLPPEGWAPKPPSADYALVAAKLDANITALADMGKKGNGPGVKALATGIAVAMLAVGAFLGIVAFLGLCAAIRVWRTRPARRGTAPAPSDVLPTTA